MPKNNSNAWAHVMAQTGVNLPEKKEKVKKVETNKLLKGKIEAPSNNERASFVNSGDDDESYAGDMGANFNIYNGGGGTYASESKDNFEERLPPAHSNSAYANYVREKTSEGVTSVGSSTPLPPRMGEADCFSKFQNAFVLQQTLASLRSSHNHLEDGQGQPIAQDQPPIKNCFGKLSDFYSHLQDSYVQAVGKYRDPYYGKKIDPNKLLNRAAGAVTVIAEEKEERSSLNPPNIPLDDTELNDIHDEEADSFANIYDEFPTSRMHPDVI